MYTADDLTLICDPDHELLHTPTAVVTDVQKVREYIPAMLAILRRTGGLGLSANQVGFSDQVFVTHIPGDWPRIFINPMIQKEKGIVVDQTEGCLSIPNEFWKRKRHTRVIVSAVGLDEDQFILDTLKGYFAYRQPLGVLLAHVIQHEMEHLDGIDVRTGEVRDS